MSTALLVSYFACLGLLTLLGLHRLVLTLVAARRVDAAEPAAPEAWPSVLLQLPLYNEAFVAERLISAAAELRYRGRLTIQILDDSTDETRRVVDRAAEAARASGHEIEVVRRPSREGYKAGALAYGLTQTDHALVAIFDADFVPAPDFLERMVPTLTADAGLGLVQARWGHLNRQASWLTRAQAVFLDGHFAVEHLARARLGHFFNFNGTAGVWRRAAIEEAGGWRDATITEDLDLSYRAQLAGWRFAYRDDVVAPAELPESWVAFRAQQARWVSGSVQTARLLLRDVLGARISAGQRLDAVIHLSNNFAYLWMAALAALLPAAVVLRDQLGWRVPGGQTLLSGLDLFMLAGGTCAMFAFYGLAAWRTGRTPRVPDVLFALCVGAGMSLTNAAEVLRGLRRRRGHFVRTPKRGEASAEQARQTYRSRLAGTRWLLEAVFLLYYLAAAAYAVHWALWGAFPFLAVYVIGFGAVTLASAREHWVPRWAAVGAAERSSA